MTDREIMLQVEESLSIIIDRLSTGETIDRQKLLNDLTVARHNVHRVTHSVIDFQIVVDNLDENILISDGHEKILYTNKAYEKNSGIPQDELIGHKVSEVLKTKKYFTAATIPEVIENKTSTIKLSNMYNSDLPGIVTSSPIFDPKGNIQYVVAVNRALSTFFGLREDFVNFISQLNKIRDGNHFVHIYSNSSDISSDNTMIGESSDMQHIKRFIENVSDTNATVLITGESGTGKELVADAIYKHSSRADKPFIKINCSSIPAQLLESELFGYEKGAFSGANAKGKKGLFEAANTGTLLLDEIGDMPIDLQAKLLRAIQTNEITRVGGITPVKLDIRLIASTNCNLKEKIAQGTFRSDLYYRLHVIPIKVPPLRERKDDIPLLCRHYLKLFNDLYNRSLKLSDKNYEILSGYSWPGNIRELRNIIEYLVVCCSNSSANPISADQLYSLFDVEPQITQTGTEQSTSLNDAMSAYEKTFLEDSLKDAKTLKEAAMILGVDISTVSRKLKQYGLSLKH